MKRKKEKKIDTYRVLKGLAGIRGNLKKGKGKS